MEERIIFMGTPEFGAAILQELLDENRNVVAVVSQPDKEAGRKRQLSVSAVKQLALMNNIPVLQPQRIKTEFQEILAYEPDLIITCAYGQIIPDELLNDPRLGCINVHASLLPKLRGGAPIQHAIIDGYDKSGVTIMEMVSKMDAGDIISQIECPITAEDTYGSLHDRLKDLAVVLLRKTMPSILDQSYRAVSQPEEEVTFGYNISREEERIDLNKDYTSVYNQIRGLIPLPGGFIRVRDQKVKIWAVKTSEKTCDKENGTLLYADDALAIVVDRRLLLIEELQAEGKKKMSARAFRNGQGRDWEGLVAK